MYTFLCSHMLSLLHNFYSCFCGAGWRGLAARLPLQGQLVELIFRLILIQRHREQAQQVGVSLHWWLKAVHHGQLLQDAEELLHLGPIKSGPGRVQPVRQGQLQGHQVLEVHTQDGEAEAHTGCQPPSVVAIVAGGRH